MSPSRKTKSLDELIKIWNFYLAWNLHRCQSFLIKNTENKKSILLKAISYSGKLLFSCQENVKSFSFIQPIAGILKGLFFSQKYMKSMRDFSELALLLYTAYK